MAGFEVLGREPVEQPIDRCFVLGDHRPLDSADLGVSERVGLGAAQLLHRAQRLEGRVPGAAELQLAVDADGPEHRRVQVVGDLGVGSSDRLVPLL